MNNILTGLVAVVLIMSSASCGIFRKGAGRGNAGTNDTTMVMHGDTVTFRAEPDSGFAGIGNDGFTDSANTSAEVSAWLPLWNRSIAYNTFNGKAKVSVESPKESNNFTATIRMEKGKRIWVSIVALGVIEAARALITPDTIIVLDKMHNEATILPFKDAGKLLPVAVEFSTLQDLIIGDALRTANDAPTSASTTGGLVSLLLKATNYEQQLAYVVADSSMTRQDVKVKNEDGSETFLAMQYRDYNNIDNRKFAKGRLLNIRDAKGITKIELDFVRVEFDQSLEYNFSVPARYKRK